MVKQCWCGNPKLIPFSPDYGRCFECETLVASEPFQAIRVKNAELVPDLSASHHWLRALLKYRRPPARILVIGCGHGEFIAFLRQAGFDALELEWSQLGKPESDFFDAIVMRDVLQHLPAPFGTIQHCLDGLKPDGLFFIQTLRFHEKKPSFPSRMQPGGNLYLFSPSSARRFFRQAGVLYLIFEPAELPHDNMFFVASRKPFQGRGPKEIKEFLPDRDQKFPCVSPSGVSNKLKRVAVDLTPLLPGGSNGGAKIAALELVKNLAGLAPDCEFVLLTSGKNHEELSLLEAQNLRRLCVTRRPNIATGKNFSFLLSTLRDKLATLAPDDLLAWAIQTYRSFLSLPEFRGLIQNIKPDILFCPFTAPFFFHPSVPTVSVIYDILFHHYPQFFSQESLEMRDQNFRDTCRLADILICGSENVRQDILKHAGLAPSRVVTVPIRLSRRLGDPGSVDGAALLEKWGLEKDSYYLYPANFWPHKNHKMLLTAWGMFLKRHPDSRLKLACPGDPDTGLAGIANAAKRMGLEKRVVFPGYVSDSAIATLYKHCRALIYPSLYEGFGMPILEAQVFGKPVLASWVASIPEIAGPSTMLFDPQNPHEIVKFIEITESPAAHAFPGPPLSHPRLEELSNPQLMAREYLEIFKNALDRNTFLSLGYHVEGLHPDGWTSGEVVIFHDAGCDNRKLEISLSLPPSFPFPVAYIQLREGGSKRLKVYLLRHGKNLRILWPISAGRGSVALTVQPLFQPREHGLNEDERWLGCFIQNWSIS